MVTDISTMLAPAGRETERTELTEDKSAMLFGISVAVKVVTLVEGVVVEVVVVVVVVGVVVVGVVVVQTPQRQF